MAKKIAKHSKPLFIDSDFVKDCIIEVSKIVCPDKETVFEQLSLSRWTIARRIDSMAEDVK